MSVFTLVAAIITLLSFFIHVFAGDREVRTFEPEDTPNTFSEPRNIWTMIRCGWHWISFDLLFASIVLFVIYFTDFFTNENEILYLLAIYFFGYSIVWLLTILLSKRYPSNLLKLGQWLLVLFIGMLILAGTPLV